MHRIKYLKKIFSSIFLEGVVVHKVGNSPFAKETLVLLVLL